MTKTAIHVDHIARVEGHGNVHVVIEDGEVKTVEMNVVEPARLFESMVRGRRFEEIPYISSRICGICSSSHVVTDLKAIERVFGVEVTDRTRALRELLVYGSYLQNHASHLFVFAAPDFLGMPSVFPLAQTDPELFEQAPVSYTHLDVYKRQITRTPSSTSRSPCPTPSTMRPTRPTRAWATRC